MKKFEDSEFWKDKSEIKEIRSINMQEELREFNAEMAEFNEKHHPGVKRCICELHSPKIKSLETINDSYANQNYSATPHLQKYLPQPTTNIKPYGNSF